MRPKGMSTHHRLPSRSNEGPSRKLSTWAPPRFGSDHAVRFFLRNFAGRDVNVLASTCLIFWNGLSKAASRAVAKHNPGPKAAAAAAGEPTLGGGRLRRHQPGDRVDLVGKRPEIHAA